MRTLDTFTRAYLECALWSSTGDDDQPLDRDHDITDIADESVAKAIADCAAFRDKAGDMLADWCDDDAGHDFWLTRNGHGAGFWSRLNKSHGHLLSDLAQKAGQSDPYIGDDGRIYLS